ncbi:hypothetical protein C8F01DRAFT_1377415, partial [Mycena amicta]
MSSNPVQTVQPSNRSGRRGIQADPVRTIQLPTRSGRRDSQTISDNVALLQAPSQRLPTMAMFNECSNMTINGGTFTMVQPNEAQQDFRTIRMGDINLLSVVKEHDVIEEHVVVNRKRPGRVHRQTVHIGTRKTYHAKIFGSQDIFTVMAYEGDLKEWKMKSAGEAPRHPNYLQLFGITDSSRMHAVIYHDELVPASEAVWRCPSRLSRKLLHYVLSIHLQSVRDYHRETHSMDLLLYGHTQWFRVPTGQLSVEIDHVDPLSWIGKKKIHHREVDRSLGTLQVIHPLQGCFSDRELLANMTFKDLLMVLGYDVAPSHMISPYYGPVQLATVYTVDELRKTCSLPLSSQFVTSGWAFGGSGGWKHFRYNEIQQTSGFSYMWSNDCLKDRINIAQSLVDINTLKPLTSGKGHSHFLATTFWPMIRLSTSWDPFQLAGTFMAEAPTTTDLYLCISVPEPYTGENGIWVDIPASREACFWSLDVDGNQRLSDEECLRLGLPDITVEARLTGIMLQEENCEIIREFRAVHGEDSDSERLKEFQRHITWHDGSPLRDSLQFDASRATSQYNSYLG